MTTKGSRIFVSSTCYDLLDLRAEVEQHLREMGLKPVMSDRPTSEFEVSGYKDSIETCLVNVRNCDAFICILSQRYGPSLKDSGYDDVSATHLEYLEAKKESKPIWMYVRDRTAGEHSTWSKNRKRQPQPMFRWVAEGEEKLFEFIQEHKKLVAGSEASNWFDVFRDSGEMKVLLSRDLKLFSGPAVLLSLLRDGRLPVIRVAVRKMKGEEAANNYEVLLRCFGASAIDAEYRQDEGVWESLSDITPGDEAQATLTLPKQGNAAHDRTLAIRYHTQAGYRIEEKHLIDLDWNCNITRISCVSKRLLEGLPYDLE